MNKMSTTAGVNYLGCVDQCEHLLSDPVCTHMGISLLAVLCILQIALVLICRSTKAMSEKEIAPYTVLHEWEDENVELRQYPAQKWASTNSNDESIDRASSSSFYKLFYYIQGKNVASQKIAMTRPMCFTISPDKENIRSRRITGSFYIPAAQQDNPPQPLNPDVFIESRPAMKIYSRSYSGFSDNKRIEEQAQLLSASLDKLDLTYWRDPYYFVGYEAPFRLFNRRNEVWFQAMD